MEWRGRRICYGLQNDLLECNLARTLEFVTAPRSDTDIFTVDCYNVKLTHKIF